MSVVLTMKHYTYATRDSVCLVCGNKVFPPYVEWHGHVNIIICSHCCLSIKPGLAADIIQVAAIAELRQLRSGRYYTGAVLERVNVKEAEARQLKEWGQDVGILSNPVKKS
jgi:hypothetical protein